MTSRPVRSLPLLLATLVVLASGCGRGGAAEEGVLVENLTERSPEVACTPLPELTTLGIHPAAVEAHPDGRIVVVDALARRLWLVASDLSGADSLVLDSQGPRGVGYPRSGVLDAAGRLVVADAARRMLLVLSSEGAEPERVPLDFAPDRVVAAPDGSFLVSRWVLDASRRALLFRVQATGVAEPFPILPLRERDLRLHALGNRLALVPEGRGGALVLHRFLHPRAYRIGRTPAAPVDTLAVPIPDGVAEAVGYRPLPPFSDEEVERMLVPVVDAARRPGGGAFLLTYTGRAREGSRETAVVRAEPPLDAGRTVLLPFEGAHLASRPADDSLVVVDALDTWHLCPAP